MAKVRGPIGALVHHSLQVGWRVLGPGTVEDERGEVIDLRTEAPQAVEARAREAARDAAWRQSVATRQDAVGLEEGACLYAAKQAISQIAKRDIEDAHMAEAMVRGALWSRDRLHRAKGGQEPACQCGHPRCTLHHAMYECPLLDQVRRSAGATAESAWAEQQLGRLGHSPALWTRGIVPKQLQGSTQVASPPIVQYGQNAEAGGFPDARTLWTDGSGRCPRDIRRRVCSWAVVDDKGNWARGTLPGAQQTVFRAELFAVVIALEGTQGAIRIASDCQGVVEKAKRLIVDGSVVHPRQHHADLWTRALRAAADRTVDIDWVPAHLGEEAVQQGRVTRDDWAGNAKADGHADAAMSLHPNPGVREERLNLIDITVLGVLELGVAVYKHIKVERDRQEAPRVPRRTALRARLARTARALASGATAEGLPAGGEGLLVMADSTLRGRGHAIQRTPTRAWCMRCPRWTATIGGLRNLIRKPCRPELVPLAKRQQAEQWRASQTREGNGQPHRPVPCRGGWVCQACGARARELSGMEGQCDPGRVYTVGDTQATAVSQGHAQVDRPDTGTGDGREPRVVAKARAKAPPRGRPRPQPKARAAGRPSQPATGARGQPGQAASPGEEPERISVPASTPGGMTRGPTGRGHHPLEPVTLLAGSGSEGALERPGDVRGSRQRGSHSPSSQEAQPSHLARIRAGKRGSTEVGGSSGSGLPASGRPRTGDADAEHVDSDGQHGRPPVHTHGASSGGAKRALPDAHQEQGNGRAEDPAREGGSTVGLPQERRVRRRLAFKYPEGR